jgi:hypothetical protein
MNERTMILACLFLGFCGLWLARDVWGGEDTGAQRPTRVTMRESPQVTETTDYFDIVFSKEPESRFFLHGSTRAIAVSQPGKKTVAPSISRVRSVAFVESDGRLIVEWNTSDGGTEKATFEGMDRTTWEQLKQFVAAKVGPGLEMRE